MDKVKVFGILFFVMGLVVGIFVVSCGGGGGGGSVDAQTASSSSSGGSYTLPGGQISVDLESASSITVNYNNKVYNWREIPFSVDMENYLIQVNGKLVYDPLSPGGYSSLSSDFVKIQNGKVLVLYYFTNTADGAVTYYMDRTVFILYLKLK